MNDLRNLSKVEVSQILGSFTGVDRQTTHGPLWYLTGSLREDTGCWNPEVFQYYHIPFGNGYPLSPLERAFIQGDDMQFPGYIADALTGYSVWWQNKKWFAPSLEYYYHRRDAPSFFDQPETLLVFVESEAERFQRIVNADGGSVLLDLYGHSDRYCISLLFPCDLVIKRFSTREDWHSYLTNLFLFAVPMKEPRLIYIDDGNIEQDCVAILPSRTETGNRMAAQYTT